MEFLILRSFSPFAKIIGVESLSFDFGFSIHEDHPIVKINIITNELALFLQYIGVVNIKNQR